MASHFCEFCFLLPLPEDKTRADLEAFARHYPAAQGAAAADPAAWMLSADGVVGAVEDAGLWVHAPCGEGHLDAAVHLTQTFLRHFALLTHGVVIPWAATCSQPVLNGFFGGAALVTATDCWAAQPWLACQEEARRRRLCLG